LLVLLGEDAAECLLLCRADELTEAEAAALLERIRDAVQDPLGLLL
jgi:hypothetical protein